MRALRTNLKIEKNHITTYGGIAWVPAIQNGYMAAPCIEFDIDYKVFEKTDTEKDQLATLKLQNKIARNAAHGADYKKHLNIWPVQSYNHFSI